MTDDILKNKIAEIIKTMCDNHLWELEDLNKAKRDNIIADICDKREITFSDLTATKQEEMTTLAEETLAQDALEARNCETI